MGLLRGRGEGGAGKLGDFIPYCYIRKEVFPFVFLFVCFFNFFVRLKCARYFLVGTTFCILHEGVRR